MNHDETFIVASSKAWHAQDFDQFREGMPGVWLYVDNSRKLLELVQSVSPAFIFFLHWNWRVPSEVIEQNVCVCFHMTDVPYGRGGSPLQNLIIRGHKCTKLTALRMVQEMDAGPVYCKRELSLEGKASEIYLRAGKISWEIIKWIVETRPVPESQVGEVVIFKRRTPEQSQIPLNGPLRQFYDYIRMLDAPTYPKAFIEYGEYTIEFSDAVIDDDNELRANVRITLKGNES